MQLDKERTLTCYETNQLYKNFRLITREFEYCSKCIEEMNFRPDTVEILQSQPKMELKSRLIQQYKFVLYNEHII